MFLYNRRIYKCFCVLFDVVLKLRERVGNWWAEFKEHKWLILVSIAILVVATFLNKAAGMYADVMGDAAVGDIILSNFGPYDFSLLFVWGYMIIVALLFIYPLFFEVGKLARVISQFSLLVVVRAIFICLTHLKVMHDAIVPTFPWFIKIFRISFHNDLFFSGHTAFAFLGFLMFKGKIRWFFLVSSFVMAFTVLAMHQHYSIDVFAAFFITYGSFKFGKWVFSKVEKIKDVVD